MKISKEQYDILQELRTRIGNELDLLQDKRNKSYDMKERESLKFEIRAVHRILDSIAIDYKIKKVRVVK